MGVQISAGTSTKILRDQRNVYAYIQTVMSLRTYDFVDYFVGITKTYWNILLDFITHLEINSMHLNTEFAVVGRSSAKLLNV